MSTAGYRTTTWALADQAIVSGGNFLTNLVLIRTLAPGSYGAYALILNALLFLNTLQGSMVAYPVCMLGALTEDEELGGVASAGLLATTLGTLLNAAVIIGACLFIHKPLLILVVTGAAFFWQSQETLRTVFASRLQYRRAIAGDALSYFGQAALLALLCWHHVPSLSIVFGAILVTSLLAALLQSLQIRPTYLDRERLRYLVREMWRLGKWSTLARLVAFTTAQAFPWLLAYSHGLLSVAAFQSLFQLVALANPLLLGFNTVITSSIANRKRTPGASPWSSSEKQIRLASLLLGSYFLLLATIGPFLMRIIYGFHTPYLANAPLLPYFALAYALESVAMFGGAILGGLGETQSNFIMQLCAMLTSVLIVFPWILHSGLRAAVLGLIAVGATRAAAAWFLAWRAMERERVVRLAEVPAT